MRVDEKLGVVNQQRIGIPVAEIVKSGVLDERIDQAESSIAYDGACNVKIGVLANEFEKAAQQIGREIAAGRGRPKIDVEIFEMPNTL